MLHDRWLYAGETRIVHRHYANVALTAAPGSLTIEELDAGEQAPAQAVTIEDSASEAETVTGAAASAAIDEAVTDDSAKVVAGRKVAGRRPVQGRKS